MNEEFDIIISGAGIAGLLIASELSATKKVLVIESNPTLQLSKYWVTLKTCVDLNPELTPCADNYFEHMDFGDSSRNLFRLTGDYLLWDTEKLTCFLKNKILINNSQIRFDQRFCGYNTIRNGIEVYVNDNCYQARLFIDCMGHNSPLVLAKDMIRIKGYYLLYGARLKLREPIDPICLSNVMLHKNPRYFEIFPTSNNEAFTTIIYPTKSITDMKGLGADFKFITSKSVYAKYFDTTAPGNKLWGIVPVGTIRRKALDHIFFFGESAQSNPAASGTGLTRLLIHYKNVANFLVDKFNNNDLSEQSLSASPVVLNSFIRKLQLYAFKDILSWNSDSYAKFISIINHVDHKIINNFLFGDLKSNDLITRRNILSLLKRKNFFLARPLLRAIR